MLIGKYQNSIDAKNRMTIPSKLREELGYRCVLSMGIDQCLYIYSEQQWKIFEEKLSRLPSLDKKARAFVRHFCGSATECELDKQGRILIPAEHREYAGITKDIVTIGDMDKVEVWSKENWDKPEFSMPMSPEELAEQMSAYGI